MNIFALIITIAFFLYEFTGLYLAFTYSPFEDEEKQKSFMGIFMIISPLFVFLGVSMYHIVLFFIQ